GDPRGTPRRCRRGHRGAAASLHAAPARLPGRLRELASELGVLLIFDETVTGFRLAYGGAQGYYGVRPDLATYGEALGGGYPIGAVAGRADVLDLVREDRLGDDRYVWFASSIGANPVSAAAALATLAELRRDGTYPRLFALGHSLRAGLAAVLQEGGITARVQADGPLAALVFTDREVVDYRTAFDSDRARVRTFLLGACSAGGPSSIRCRRSSTSPSPTPTRTSNASSPPRARRFAKTAAAES